MHEFELRGHERGEIHAVNGLAKHGPIARGLALGISIENEIEFLSAEQISVVDFFRGVAFHTDQAIGRGQLVGWNAETIGGEPEERFASSRSGLRQSSVIEICRVERLASRCVALIGRIGRIGIDELHAIECYAKFFGDQLRLGGNNSLPKFLLARERGHATIRGNRKP